MTLLKLTGAKVDRGISTLFHPPGEGTVSVNGFSTGPGLIR